MEMRLPEGDAHSSVSEDRGTGVETEEVSFSEAGAVSTPEFPPVPRLQLLNIRKAFGESVVLSNVDLEVRAGEIHGIVGQNGAGKSTLMRLLGGSYSEFSGTIMIDGRRVEPGTPRGALAAGVAVIYQEFSLVPSMTVAENIMLGVETGMVYRRKGVIEAAREVAERVGLAGDLPLEAQVGSLSASVQQLVEIAKALGRSAKILVLDEPTSRLAGADRLRLFALMRKVAASGTAVIFISHFLEEVLAVADNILILRDGRVVGNEVAAKCDVARLSSLMLGEVLATEMKEEASSVRREVSDEKVVLAATGVSCGWQVRDVTLSVRAGEIVGLAGVVGSGRSSLARALVGADRVKQGRVAIHGSAVHFKSPGDARRTGVALVPEDRKTQGLVALRSAADNVSMMALTKSTVWHGFLRKRRLKELSTEVVRDFEIRPPDMSLAAGTFSGGNQQKLLLARVIMGRPDLLIVDQPTVGVDVGARAQVHRILHRAAGRGAAILVISDDIDELAAVSDRVLVMRRGKVVAEFDRAQIDKAALVSIMSAREN